MKVVELINLNPNVEKKQKKILLAELLNKKPIELFVIEQEISKKIEKKYKKGLKDLEKGIPVQYILKNAYFYGNKFYVNKNVLIPRPETELLIQYTNEYINQYFKEMINTVDIGTGSGIIAITLKKINSGLNVTATDISKKALKVAKKNARQNDVKIIFKKGDLLKPLKNKYDVLISNPPYIKNNSTFIENQVKDNEPHTALYGGEDGLKFYKEILKQAKEKLNKDNIIALEIGEDQKCDIIKLAKENFPDSKIISQKDFNDFDRYIFIINNQKSS